MQPTARRRTHDAFVNVKYPHKNEVNNRTIQFLRIIMSINTALKLHIYLHIWLLDATELKS